jgi:preprotein translocase subunit SecG
MSFLFWLCLILFIFICVFMILLILIQKGRGGGLASAFGGMGGNTAFGSKTGDVLTWATSIVFGIFIVLAVSLNLLANYRQREANRTAGMTPNQVTDPSTPAPKPAPK